MKNKEIKFNFIGAIGVLILVVAIIIGVIVIIPKIKANRKNIGNRVKSADIDVYKEYNETITLLTGKERECRLRFYKSQLDYAMKYETDLFYIQKGNEDFDQYISLYSNSVNIIVEKQSGSFNDLEKNLEEEGQKTIEENKRLYSLKEEDNYYYNGDTYVSSESEQDAALKKKENEKLQERNVGNITINATEINGEKAFVRTIISKEQTEQTYCIRIDDNNYYRIDAFCGEEYEKNFLPIMEYMIKSFTIFK